MQLLCGEMSVSGALMQTGDDGGIFALSLENHRWRDVEAHWLCWNHTGGLEVQDAGPIFASLHCSYHKVVQWMEIETMSEGSLHQFENEMTQRHYQIWSWRYSSVME